MDQGQGVGEPWLPSAPTAPRSQMSNTWVGRAGSQKPHIPAHPPTATPA